MIYRKKGISMISNSIMLLISMLFITVIFIFSVNAIIPFIWYEKLNNVALKYMFVIEKYGYLTESEKNLMLADMERQGFNLSKINIDYPKNKEAYGQLVYLNIHYNMEIDAINFSNGEILLKKQTIPLNIIKNSFCKM